MPMIPPIINASQYSFGEHADRGDHGVAPALREIETRGGSPLGRPDRRASRPEQASPHQCVRGQDRKSGGPAHEELTPPRHAALPLLCHRDGADRERDVADEEVVAHHRGEPREEATDEHASTAALQDERDREQRERDRRSMLPEVGAVEEQGREEADEPQRQPPVPSRGPSREPPGRVRSQDHTQDGDQDDRACSADLPERPSDDDQRKARDLDPPVAIPDREQDRVVAAVGIGGGCPVAEVWQPRVRLGHRLDGRQPATGIRERRSPRVAQPRDGEGHAADEEQAQPPGSGARARALAPRAGRAPTPPRRYSSVLYRPRHLVVDSASGRRVDCAHPGGALRRPYRLRACQTTSRSSRLRS